jgi:1-acyl-sn-glycerol-3-phosphate acyltransferase
MNENCPRMGNALTRAIGGGLLKLMGWKIEGTAPNVPKVILLGEPHTSNWDFVLIMMAAQSAGLRMSYIMKKEAFFWPLGGFFKWMGGIPIERKKGKDAIAGIEKVLRETDNIFLAITPSGSRSPKESFKTGYLRLAHATQTPMLIIGLHAPTKSIILDRLVDPDGDIDIQNKSIKDYIDGNYRGIKPENQRHSALPETAPETVIGARE